MRTRWNLASILVLGGIILAGLMLMFPARSATTEESQLHYGADSLIGSTSEEVEQYALRYVRQHLIVSGTPRVLLMSSIAQADRPSLGLGCPQAKLTIEEPPQTLVILEGDFDVSNARSGLASKPPWHFSYVAYIFSQWSGHHVTFIYSRNGERFRVALNDPTLPSDGPGAESAGMPLACPTQLPYPLTQHYGEIAPTIIAKEAPTGKNTPTPGPILPDPIPTTMSK
jgi:hypothetical protein